MLTLASFFAVMLVPAYVVAQHRLSSPDISFPSPVLVALGCGFATIISSALFIKVSSTTSLFPRHVRSFILPFVVVDVIPSVIICTMKQVPHIGGLSAVAALALAAVGFWLMTWTISLFDVLGKGTLAPFDPTSKLIVRGPYSYTRNPMISGVLFLLAAVACLYQSVAVAGWTLFFFAAKTVYFLFDEEPVLEQRYGASYLKYKAAVPRWLPNLTPYVDKA